MNKKILKAMGFNTELERIENHQCPLCGIVIDVTKFRDDLSKREYKISGLCQKCQDYIFSIPGEGLGLISDDLLEGV
jgi:pyrimidine operon attenuation protein/uracil phosphoribosyltransferase